MCVCVCVRAHAYICISFCASVSLNYLVQLINYNIVYTCIHNVMDLNIVVTISLIICVV